MTRRLLSRLAGLTAAEARWRATTAARTASQRVSLRLGGARWDRRRLREVLQPDAPGADAARSGDWAAAHRALSRSLQMDPPRFVIGPSLRERVVSAIRRDVPHASADAATRAARITEGRFDLLGYDGLRFEAPDGLTPDWHLDPVHARRAPLRFWSSVPYLDPAIGDHKIVWELNRHQHLLALGRAYWLTDDPRHRQLALDHIASWVACNPPLTGINWASMLELGFRSIAWIWAMHFFASEAPEHDERPWLVDTVLVLDRQLRHIEQNLSYYFSPNTHLLGEALALYVAGRSLTWLTGSAAYADTGRRILLDEATNQIAADGGHLERSTHYQRYTLDFYILALAIARLTHDGAADALAAVVTRLATATRLLADDRGWLPHLGDDDGGQMLPMCGTAADNVAASLAIAGALTGQTQVADTTAEETYWMLAHPVLSGGHEPAVRLSSPERVVSGRLPETGYCVSRGPDGTHVVFDAGAHGFANAGHAHADALSFTLSVRGVPLFVDPGTGSYTADRALRDRLRSTALHNTVTVDGRSQSHPSGPFHWAQVANTRAERWRTGRSFDYMEASHDGYAPATHRRHILVVHGDLMVVADLLDGHGTHLIESHWHLSPQWDVLVSDRRAALLGPERLTWAAADRTLTVLDGSTPDAGGIWSPVYGRVEPTRTLRLSMRGPLPLWLVTAVSLTPHDDVVAVSRVQSETTLADGGLAVRIVRSRGTDLFVVAPERDNTGTPAPWRVADLTCDARMLFTRVSGPGGQFAMVDGSFAAGGPLQHAVSLPARELVFGTALTRSATPRNERGSRPFTEVG